MILVKFKNSLRSVGLLETAKKIYNYSIAYPARNKFKKEALALRKVEDRFTWIYKNNYWGNQERLSGVGSTLKATENLRSELPQLIAKFHISSILDAPCGDFNWMKLLLDEVDVTYIGADIVQGLIGSLNEKYKSSNINFIKINLIEDKFPDADLMICRDCLFHLSYEDIYRVLANFSSSNISYLLTTTHINHGSFENTDIETGDFRLIDLFSHPFDFPSTPLARISDWIMPDPEREMCLFSREQILPLIAIKAKHLEGSNPTLWGH